MNECMYVYTYTHTHTNIYIYTHTWCLGGECARLREDVLKLKYTDTPISKVERLRT